MLIREPGGRHLDVGGERTRLMGVLNVTPDSFFDGGLYRDHEAAVARGVALVEAGADVLDIGGESTRPGHDRVAADVQLRRVLPVVERLSALVDVPISVDTTRSAVARACLDAGAHWINDTSALTEDAQLADLAAERRCPIVLMHRFDPPRKDGDAPRGRAVVERIAERLARRVEVARGRGIAHEQILLDPGIGFGTSHADNPAILAHVEPIRELGFPLLFGPSRKSFLGRITGRDVDARLCATAAAVACVALAGIEIVRVHDVAEMRDVAAVADAIRTARSRQPQEVQR